MENENVVNVETAIDTATRTARRRPSRDASSVRDMKTLVRFARTVTTTNFADALAAVNANHGVSHASRNVGRFSRGRIMDVQNETIRDNAEWQLNDVQLLFVWRADFPVASGRVFQSSPADGVAIVRGVRADYNRTGHGAKFPRTEPSIQYGPKRFEWSTTATTATTKTA